MKKLITTFTLLIVFISINAQKKVALQHNGTSTIFNSTNPFLDAYTAAVNGDTIYLPGGILLYPTTIDKGLTIIGAGHNPNETLATNKTILNGAISITGNADNLHMEGIEFNGIITFNSNIKADNVVIKRCKALGITYAGTGATPCENNTIINNIITGGLSLENAKSSLFCNNIITGIVAHGINNGISNNLLLLDTNNYAIYNVDNSEVSNNIIFQKYRTDYIITLCDLSSFSYNIFAATPSAASIGTSVLESNNWLNISLLPLFVNMPLNAFDYSYDYHLLSPTTYVNSASSQVGIYGGFFPYKENTIPVNPHIVTKSISSQTNSSGEINVNISVEAQ